MTRTQPMEDAVPDLPTTPTRRQLVSGIAAGIALPCVLAACGQPTTPAAGTPPPTTGGGSGDPAPKALAALGDLPVGGGKIVDSDGRKVLLVRTGAAEVKGFDPTCPHAGAIVKAPEGGTITCPLHGSTFDAATGAKTKGPAATGLKPVAVRVEKDQVLPA